MKRILSALAGLALCGAAFAAGGKVECDYIQVDEGTAPTGAAGRSLIYALSSDHALKAKIAGNTEQGIALTGTANVFTAIQTAPQLTGAASTALVLQAGAATVAGVGINLNTTNAVTSGQVGGDVTVTFGLGAGAGRTGRLNLVASGGAEGSGTIIADGSLLTSLTAANVTGSHTLPDGVLSANVPFNNAFNYWVAGQDISAANDAQVPLTLNAFSATQSANLFEAKKGAVVAFSVSPVGLTTNNGTLTLSNTAGTGAGTITTVAGQNLLIPAATTGNLTITRTTVNNGILTLSNTAGTGAGNINTVAGQALNIDATEAAAGGGAAINITAGAAGGTAQTGGALTLSGGLGTTTGLGGAIVFKTQTTGNDAIATRMTLANDGGLSHTGTLTQNGSATFSDAAGTGDGTITTVADQDLNVAASGTGTLSVARGATFTAGVDSQAGGATNQVVGNGAGAQLLAGVSTTVSTKGAGDTWHYSRTSNIITLTTSAAHGIIAGQWVRCAGFGATAAAALGTFQDQDLEVMSQATSTTFTLSFGGDDVVDATTIDEGATITPRGLGESVTAMGYGALGHTSGSNYKTAFGYNAGHNSRSPYTTFIGNSAGVAITTGTNLTIIGTNAAVNATQIDSSLVVGEFAGATLTTTAYNTLLGVSSDVAASATYQALAIGYGSVADSNELVAGSGSAAVNDLYFGKGKTAAAPGAVTVHGSGSTGTGVAGGALQIAGGAAKATDATSAGGAVVIRTQTNGGTAMSDRLTVAADGTVTAGGRIVGGQLTVNGAAYTFPGAIGGAGTYLYDAAGDGTLTWNTVTSLTGTTQSGTPFLTVLGSSGANSATGVNNTAVGYQAGHLLATGTNNTLVGYKAGPLIAAGGNYNVVIGSTAGSAISTGDYNIAIGYLAGIAVSTGTNTLCIGGYAGYSNTGTANTFIGYGAGQSITSATGELCIGANAGGTVTGANNTIIGTNAVTGTLTTGTNNVILGQGVTISDADADSSVVIGNAAVLPNTFEPAIIIGDAATVTAANQFVAGSANTTINDVYFGKGVTNSTATAYTIHGTGGSGLNDDAAALQLAGGICTGSGVPGSVIIKTASSGTDSDPGTLSDRVTVASSLNAGNSYDDTAVTLATAKTASLNMKSISENITIADDTSSTSATNLLPANAYIIGVVARVTTVLPNGPVTWSLGVAGDTARFVAAGTSGDAGTTGSSYKLATPLAPYMNSAAAPIVVTHGDPNATTGRIRVTVFYFDLTEPGS